jgi:hypothetical protein
LILFLYSRQCIPEIAAKALYPCAHYVLEERPGAIALHRISKENAYAWVANGPSL